MAEANVFGGIAKGSITATPIEGHSAIIKTQFQMADVDLESSMGELLGIRKVAGKGTLNVALEASGSNSYELAQTVNGTAMLAGREGALIGFNIEQLLRRLERRPLSGTGDFRNGRTPFSTIDIALRVTDGTANVEDAKMVSTTMRMALAGTASIRRANSICADRPALVATGTDAPFELPFVVQGPWDNAMILPDTEILLRRSPASAPLLEFGARAAHPRRVEERHRPADEPRDAAGCTRPRHRMEPSPARSNLSGAALSPRDADSRDSTAAAIISSATAATISVETALICGFTPRRTSE